MGMLRWTGVCIGALALFSLLERYINFGLAPYLNTVVGLYRGVLHPIGDKLMASAKALASTYHINVPAMPWDAVILYALFSIAIAHFLYNKREDVKKQLGAIPAAFVLAPFALLWPAIGFGNILALCIAPKLGTSNILFGWDTEVARVIAICIALFSANAYLLA